ncbi:MAG: alcohol dehydrogenase catalytic domain-containing protein [Veillonellales bacterium]
MEWMKALVFYGPGDIRLKRHKIPVIRQEEMLIRVKAAGVCGTDIRIYNGTKEIEAPRIIGHEFAGDIIAVGKCVKNFAAGERVTVYPIITCNDCYACKTGRTNICSERITLGYELDGGFAEYVRIPANAIANGNVNRLPSGVSYEEGAVSEPLTAAYSGIRRANVKAGNSVLIVGGGPIGLLHTQLSKLYGAGLIIVSEPQKEKRLQAKFFGADAAVDPLNESLQKLIDKMTGGAGMDIVIADVGVPEIVEKSVEYVKRGGKYVIFAGCPAGSRITIDPNQIHYKELVITGSSAAKPTYQRKILKMIAAGQVDVKTVISDVFPVERWQEAFNMKENYKGLKYVLTF